jgi:hypothetical protein
VTKIAAKMKSYKTELTQAFVDGTSIPGTYLDKLCPGLQLIISENSKRYQVRQKAKGKAVKRGIGKAADYSLAEARTKAKQLLTDIDQGSHLRTKKALEDYLKYCVVKLGGEIIVTAKDRKAIEQKSLAVELVGKDVSVTVTSKKRQG